MGYYITIQEIVLRGQLPKIFDDEIGYWRQDKKNISPREFYFKLGDDFEESLAIMAKHNISGEVIIMGEEGEYTKYVLKNNKVEMYDGVVVFPKEPSNIIN